MATDLDRSVVAAVRALAMDAVEEARSGHPGTPMGLAPVAYRIMTRLLRYDPGDPSWPDRDRLVLSCGHASMLLYALLHLTGYQLPMSELRRFRQLGSATPGHPEVDVTPGVEVATGPLGQGLANAVGMALAEAMLAARFNRPGHRVVDHRTVAIVSDGDLMEGISHEAASLAGHLGLERLVVVYDDNRTTIEGSTELSVSDDVVARFAAYGWRTLEVDDGEDLDRVDAALDAAATPDGRPVFVRVATTIAHGAPTKAGSAAAHGAPLGAEEVAGAKAAMGWTHPPFVVPEAVAAHADQRAEGAARHAAWRDRVVAYERAHPELAAELRRVLAGELPADWDTDLAKLDLDDAVATRTAGHAALNALAARVPELVGGSADLASSTGARIDGGGSVVAGGYDARNVHFGVREHAMVAVAVGMARHGGWRLFTSTYLVFTDYLRPALRMAALMGVPLVVIATHDSVWVGEDGPTHQPEGHLAAVRAVPNLDVVRPADARETAGAWRHALTRGDGPTLIALTRQPVPALPGSREDAVAEGGYVVRREDGPRPDLVLVATGSEVALALAAERELAADGWRVRVASLPCWERFAARPEPDRAAVLPPGVPTLAVEAAVDLGWCRWADDAVAVSGYGASGPGAEVAARAGLTAAAVADRARRLLAR